MIDVLRGLMLRFSTLFVDSVCMCVWYCYNITLDIRSTSGTCIFVYYLNTRNTTVCIISYINVLF